MRLGCTARAAMDPAVLLAFVEHHTEYRHGGHPRRTRRMVNGFFVGQGDPARTLRRLRSARFATVSVSGAARLLESFNLTIDDLDRWARQQGKSARID